MTWYDIPPLDMYGHGMAWHGIWYGLPRNSLWHGPLSGTDHYKLDHSMKFYEQYPGTNHPTEWAPLYGNTVSGDHSTNRSGPASQATSTARLIQPMPDVRHPEAFLVRGGLFFCLLAAQFRLHAPVVLRLALEVRAHFLGHVVPANVAQVVHGRKDCLEYEGNWPRSVKVSREKGFFVTDRAHEVK